MSALDTASLTTPQLVELNDSLGHLRRFLAGVLDRDLDNAKCRKTLAELDRLIAVLTDEVTRRARCHSTGCS